METLTHYTNPMSRGMRTQKILEVFDLPHESISIDFMNGQTRTEEYLKIHPYGRVPALKHGDLTVIESGAITLYLCDLFAEELKAPRPGTPERALLYEWLFFFQTTLEPVAIKGMSDKSDKRQIQGEVRTLLTAMASRFRGPYVLGEEFTVLDAILHVELAWYKMMGIFPEGLEPYQGFLSRTAERMEL
jgi:glutathione S-transferase